MELIFSIASSIALLVAIIGVPLFAYSYADMKLSQKAVDQVCLKWCSENNFEFVKVEIWKRHIALIYKENGKKQRKKFIAHFAFFSWKIKRVEWLN